MKREIKFRFWNVGNNHWVNPNKIEFTYQDDDNESIGIPFHLYQEEIIYQQYTGLKDSKGKEIYEGDVVKIIYDKAIGEVYFDFNLGAFRLKDKSSKSYPITTYRFDEVNKPIGLVNVADEVIGNIFENSELLEQ